MTYEYSFYFKDSSPIVHSLFNCQIIAALSIWHIFRFFLCIVLTCSHPFFSISLLSDTTSYFRFISFFFPTPVLLGALVSFNEKWCSETKIQLTAGMLTTCLYPTLPWTKVEYIFLLYLHIYQSHINTFIYIYSENHEFILIPLIAKQNYRFNLVILYSFIHTYFCPNLRNGSHYNLCILSILLNT